MTANEEAYAAFCELVRQQTLQIYDLAQRGDNVAIQQQALSLCSLSAQRRRELLGEPEPDPTVDYDPDYHWDGTKRLPGEQRIEKEGDHTTNLDLLELHRLFKQEEEG